MDSYRPGESRRPPFRDSDLYFREPDSYRPRQYDHDPRPPPPWPPSNYGDNGMYHFQGSRDKEPPRPVTHPSRPGYQSTRPPTGPRQDYRRRPPPPIVRTAADRPLFRGLRHDGDVVSAIVRPSSRPNFKFRNLDDLTDSEEEEMAQSDDEEKPCHANKRMRLDRADSSIAPAASKWSNPDPYTSLPPVGDVTAKRTDVVKLIRKARVETNRSLPKSKRPNDFISFDAEEHDSSEESALSSNPSPSPPTPLPPVAPRANTASMVTGKRKRGPEIGDEGQHPRAGEQLYVDERVPDKWTTTLEVDSTPWLQSHPCTDSAGVALHKEIIDFYHWVKPKPQEEEVRGAVFQRLNNVLQKFTGGELKAFGSYAAGLYLPIADMDLVYLTHGFRHRISSKVQASKLIHAGADFLKRSGIAQGPVVRIPHAKVPIIKFVDRISGLKIDLSFDNDTGIVAIDTFYKWKKDYPVMPIIVSVIKQYLMIRELNDVSTGGLGGFSTICLVTSLLQHLPVTQRPINLGDVLLEFFNFYGNVFNRKLTVLRLDPPAYLDKATHADRFNDKDNARLTIIDPHRSDNNISGGTKHIDVIFDSFSKAHSSLVTRLSAHEEGLAGSASSSFLGCLIGGNFTPYDEQRQRLQDLSVSVNADPIDRRRGRTANGSTRSVGVDRVPFLDAHLSEDDSFDQASFGQRQRKTGDKGVRRAQRLKELRPELAASIRHSISRLDALKIGGYRTATDMFRDLDIREAAAAKLAKQKR